MRAIDKIKEAIGGRVLAKKLARQKRVPFFENFTSVKTVGILFNATENENLELVKRYVRYLKEEGKKVKVIGFFSTKEIPDITYSRVEYDFFSKKDLNWYLKPALDEDFINQEFDLLIDLNIHEDFPLYYIAALSKAKFKIGRYSAGNSIYDLMIEVPLDKGIKYLLRNIDHYLLLINKKEKIA